MLFTNFTKCLTSCIHDSQHYRWYPSYLTIWCVEDLLYFFEEHGDGFGKGIGKSNGDKSPKDHNPSPASIRGWVIWRSCCRRHFLVSVSSPTRLKNKERNGMSIFFPFFHIKLHYSIVLCRDHKNPSEERSISSFNGTTEQEYLLLEAKLFCKRTCGKNISNCLINMWQLLKITDISHWSCIYN